MGEDKSARLIRWALTAFIALVGCCIILADWYITHQYGTPFQYVVAAIAIVFIYKIHARDY